MTTDRIPHWQTCTTRNAKRKKNYGAIGNDTNENFNLQERTEISGK